MLVIHNPLFQRIALLSIRAIQNHDGDEDMSVDAAKASQPRSWTANDEPNTHRIAILFWIVVALIFIIWMLWYFRPASEAKIFAASIDITSYKSPFPPLKYGTWQSSDPKAQGINSYLQLEKKGLAAWNELLTNRTWNNRLELNELHLKIKESSENANLSLSEKDTVVLHLRCLAAVYPLASGKQEDDDQEFELGIVAGENGSLQERSHPIGKILADLCKLPVRNVVVLADLCDLERLPGEGLVANPIASYAKRSLDTLHEQLRSQSKPSPRLWFLCAANDSQPALYSDKLQQTLFEHSVLSALKPSNGSFLSFADFYKDFRESVLLRSGNLQTPMLMLLDPSQPKVIQSSDLTSALATSASETVVAFRGGTIEKLPAKVDPRKTASITQVFNRSPGGRTASIQEPEATSKTLATSKTPAAANSTTQDDFLKLRFWELRDYLLLRRHVANDSRFRPTWSPADFAPARWRHEQLRWANEHKKMDEAPDRRLDDLARLLFKGSKSNEIKEFEESWSEFENDSFQRIWEDPQSRSVWNKYVAYADAALEVLFWRDLIINLPDDSESQESAVKDFQALVDEVLKAKKNLPYSENEEFVKWTSFEPENTIAIRQRLRQWMQQEVLDLDVSDSRKLDWITEKRFQTLLASPLLQTEQRKTLLERFDRFSNDPSNYDSSRVERLRRVDQTIFRLAMEKILTAVIGRDSMSESLSDEKWGPWYRERIRRSAKEGLTDSRSNSLLRWHLGALTDVDENTNGSLLLPPADPMSIRLKLAGDSTIDLADPSAQKRMLQIKVERLASKVPLEDCQLTIVEKIDEVRVRSAAPSPPKDLIPGTPSFMGSSGNLAIQFEVSNPKIPPSGIRTMTISVRCGNHVDSIPIQIVYNSRKIELIAYDRDNKPLKKSLSDNSFIPQIEIPSFAIAGTAREFQFGLLNKLGPETKRVATVEVFYLKGLDLSQVRSEAELIAIARKSHVRIASTAKLNLQQELTPVVWDKPQPIPELVVNHSHLLFVLSEWGEEEKQMAENCLVAEFSPIKPLELISKDILKISPTIANNHVEFEFTVTDSRFWREFVGDKKELKIEVSALNSQNALFKRDFLLLQERKPSGVFPLDVREDIRFDIAVGDYPRTKYYRYRDVDKETPKDVSPSINRFDSVKPIVAKMSDATLDPKIIESLLSPEPIDPGIKNSKFKFYLPNYLHPPKFVEQPPTPTKLVYQSLIVRSKVDLLPGHSAKLDFINSQGDTEFSLSSLVDRTYWATISFEGAMQVGYRADELQFDITRLLDNVRDGDEQMYKVELIGSDEPDQIELVRDLKVPEVPRISLKRLGVLPIELEVKVGQDLSGVSRCVVGIGNPGPARKTFGTFDQKSIPQYFSIQSDLSILKLQAAHFAELRLSAGDLIPLFLRSIDRCGNYQDDISEPREVEWPGEPSTPKSP